MAPSLLACDVSNIRLLPAAFPRVGAPGAATGGVRTLTMEEQLRIGRRTTAVLAVALCALLAPTGSAAAQEAPAEGYYVDEEELPFEASGSFVTDRVWGVENDAGYRIEKPAGTAWNGELVTYSHGFVSPLQRELVVQNPPLRDYFLSRGYAWAASSYSKNGYVVEEGVEQTQQLLQVFEREFGVRPERRYATGFSMGGHIVGAMIERYPDSYAGALPACGVMGDKTLYDYFLGHAAVAQTLAGVDAAIPPPDDYLTDVVPEIRAELGYGPGVSLNGAGHQLSAVTEQLSGGERPLFAEAFDFWSDAAAVGELPFLLGVYGGALTGGPASAGPDFAANAEQTYQLDDDPAVSAVEAALNADVPRVEQTGDAPFPLLTGSLGNDTKVLTLHTIGDLFVPFSMEQEYRADAIEQGTEERLVQRAIRALGHCQFSPAESVQGFADLVAWVEDGTVPAGDEVLDPAVVADRDYGCAFTTPERPGLPACGTSPAFDRVDGDNRIATAAALVERSFATADTVVLARADAYADALAAAPLAGRLDAPVLLTGRDALPAVVAERVKALGATTAVVLGGRQAVSDEVLAQLSEVGITTATRIGGTDRFDTARLVAEQLGGETAFVVRGSAADPLRGWPDAVSVSALAAFLEKPVLLVEQERVPAATAAALDGRDALTVVGGEDAVSSGVESQLAELAAGEEGDADDVAVDRVAGDSRYATSAAVAALALRSGMELDGAYLATGTAFADALVAGPVAAADGRLLLLVDGDPAEVEPTLALLDSRSDEVGEVVLVGGPAALSTQVEAAVRRLLE